MKNKIYYHKYEHWNANTPINDILIELDNFAKKGWEVVSHSQNIHGMSVILKKNIAG